MRESLQFDSECGHYYAATTEGSLGNPSGKEYLSMAKEPEGKEIPDRSIPSIHMPRWASRITLEITGVRVERLQDISEADAIAEGCNPARQLSGYDDIAVFNAMRLLEAKSEQIRVDYAIARYMVLWNSISSTPDKCWTANPWVWVVEFKRV